MTSALRHMLLCGAVLATGPALACSPVLHDAAKTVAGDNCAVQHVAMPVGVEGLKEAENLGLGYVGHVYYEGDSCSMRESQVVIDCADGTAFQFGPPNAMTSEERVVANDDVYGKMLSRLHRMPWGLDEMAGWDDLGDLRLENLGSTLEGPVVLGVSGETYDLTCACKLYTPDAKGAGK